jgi:hypothetical protein
MTESYQVYWIPWWMHAAGALTVRRWQLDRDTATTLARLKTIEPLPAR